MAINYRMVCSTGKAIFSHELLGVSVSSMTTSNSCSSTRIMKRPGTSVSSDVAHTYPLASSPLLHDRYQLGRTNPTRFLCDVLRQPPHPCNIIGQPKMFRGHANCPFLYMRAQKKSHGQLGLSDREDNNAIPPTQSSRPITFY